MSEKGQELELKQAALYAVRELTESVDRLAGIMEQIQSDMLIVVKPSEE